LSDKKIGTEIYYPVPLHLQQCFEYLGYQKGQFPASEKAAESVFSIPIHPELAAQDMSYVSDSLVEILQTT